MRVVVDTNIIFRALLSRTSPIWETLLRTDLQDSVFAPRFLVVEIEDHWERICEKTKLPEDDLVAARDEIFRLLTFVDLEDVSVEHRRLAYDLCRDVDPKDIPFIALTLHLQALLWTNDRELKKGVLPKGFSYFFESRVSTQTMVDYLRAAGSITGQSLVRDSRVDPDGDAVIVFFHDFDDYRRARPTSRLTRKQFAQYLGTGDHILKTLLLDSMRILRNLPTLRSIEIVLPFDDDIRSVKLGRAAAEEYFDVDLLELAHQPERWVQFVDEFGYDREKRREFFRRFGRQGKA